MLVVTPLLVVAIEKLQLVLVYSQVDLVAAPHLEDHSEECTKSAQLIPVHSIQCTHYTHTSMKREWDGSCRSGKG